MKQKKKLRLKRKQKKQIAVLSAIILVASFAAILLLTPLFNISEITVQGNSVISDEEIVKSAGIVEGINIFDVSLRRAQKNIEEIGYIDEVKVKRKFPSKIEIKIVEAVGVACVTAENGFVVITSDGRCLELSETAAVSTFSKNNSGEASLTQKNLPVIKGLKNVKYKVGKTITSDDKTRLNKLFECLKAFTKSEFIFDMTQIDVSDMNDIKFFYNGGKLVVSVGSGEKLDYKMECFKPILAEIGEDPEGYVDMERMYYRKKE